MPQFSTKSTNILRVAIILAAKTKKIFLMYVFHKIANSLWNVLEVVGSEDPETFLSNTSQGKEININVPILPILNVWSVDNE